jgi:hypothetical protein
MTRSIDESSCRLRKWIAVLAAYAVCNWVVINVVPRPFYDLSALHDPKYSMGFPLPCIELQNGRLLYGSFKLRNLFIDGGLGVFGVLLVSLAVAVGFRTVNFEPRLCIRDLFCVVTSICIGVVLCSKGGLFGDVALFLLMPLTATYLIIVRSRRKIHT